MDKEVELAIIKALIGIISSEECKKAIQPILDKVGKDISILNDLIMDRIQHLIKGE